MLKDLDLRAISQNNSYGFGHVNVLIDFLPYFAVYILSIVIFGTFQQVPWQWFAIIFNDAGRWKNLEVPVLKCGQNLPPGWNRVDWSAKYWGVSGPPLLPGSGIPKEIVERRHGKPIKFLFLPKKGLLGSQPRTEKISCEFWATYGAVFSCFHLQIFILFCRVRTIKLLDSKVNLNKKKLGKFFS